MNWPRVTQVLRHFGMGSEYAGLAAHYARRGRHVDAAVRLIAAGLWSDDDEAWLKNHPECEPYVRGAQLFQRENMFRLDGGFESPDMETTDPTEKVIGHPDLPGTLDTVPVLLELKTGGIPPWWDLQATAYKLMLPEPAKRHIYCLNLTEDGSYRLIEAENPHRLVDEWRMLARTFWLLANRGLITLEDNSNGFSTAAPR